MQHLGLISCIYILNGLYESVSTQANCTRLVRETEALPYISTREVYNKDLGTVHCYTYVMHAMLYVIVRANPSTNQRTKIALHGLKSEQAAHL